MFNFDGYFLKKQQSYLQNWGTAFHCTMKKDKVTKHETKKHKADVKTSKRKYKMNILVRFE